MATREVYLAAVLLRMKMKIMMMTNDDEFLHVITEFWVIVAINSQLNFALLSLIYSNITFLEAAIVASWKFNDSGEIQTSLTEITNKLCCVLWHNWMLGEVSTIATHQSNPPFTERRNIKNNYFFYLAPLLHTKYNSKSNSTQKRATQSTSITLVYYHQLLTTTS